MARTPSNMLPLGTIAPTFELPDTISGKNMSLKQLRGSEGTVIFFICNHCPYVLHVIEELVSIAKAYQDRGFSFIAISSNDVIKYPQDGPDKMKEFAEASHFLFPYLFDESQGTARDYEAACTPDIYVFDRNLVLVYRGRLDDSRPGNEIPVTGADLRFALTELVHGKPVSPIQKPSIGCNIKWKESTIDDKRSKEK
jgi:peroxiredoxin